MRPSRFAAAAFFVERHVGPRTRKLVGSIGVLMFLAVYVWAAITVGEYVPRHWAAQLAYFATAGLLWGVPILPLFAWMQKKG
jgi:ABC-type maltose transport system permease subunit